MSIRSRPMSLIAALAFRRAATAPAATRSFTGPTSMSISFTEESMSLLSLRIPALIFASVVSVGRLTAQDDPKPWNIGDFANDGFVTAGYRFTDIHGYEPKYEEL